MSEHASHRRDQLPSERPSFHPHCCPSGDRVPATSGVSRRGFLSVAALGGAALGGLSWSTLAAASDEVPQPPARKPLVVKPIFTYHTCSHRPQTSWRPWGGIETQAQAEEEVARIQQELATLKASADFPVEFLPVSAVRGPGELGAVADLAQADTILIYASGGPQSTFDELVKLGKDVVFFVRWKSGPVYLWYEIVSPRWLRQHTDALRVKGIDDGDVVVDDQNEILWRLRALAGLKNTIGTKILAVGGPGAWSGANVPEMVKTKWKWDIQTVSYDELGKLIEGARKDEAAVALARRRAEEYLKLPGTTLETERAFVDNAMLLENIFRKLMVEAGCRAITINSCMGTIMPISQTTACLPLSTLNDDGFLAFCESDFVVIPAGVLACNISGRPPFLNDPTYPFNGIITLAHCTGPRKLDGKTLEPARIVTHFESDYGAAPKVEMHNGQVVTNIIPDFAAERWVGLLGEIVDHPFRPICRAQIDIRFTCDSKLLAERMPGFHWMTIYGDYMKELGYAMKRTPIRWEPLG